MGKNWMKRFISITVCAVMTFALAGTALADDAHFTYTDIEEPQPDLYVAKTVSSAVEGYTAPEGDTFTFVLKWDQDGDGYTEFAENVQYYVYNEDGTRVTNDETGSYIFRTSSTGRFTLQDGQYAYFEYAGEIAYEITELVEDPYINTSGDKTGTIDAKGTYVTFENLYVPPQDTGGGDTGGDETTQLIIRKDLSWVDGYETPDFSDIEFTFTVNVDGAPYANAAYDIYDADVTTRTDSGRTDADGTFTMTGDSAVVFPEVPVDVDYEVEETGTEDGWRATGETRYAGATASPMVYCYFNNEGADFVVTKERTDGVAGEDFSFLLTDAAGGALTGIPCYTYDENGTLTGSGVTDSTGAFTIASGERVIFAGIPDGTEYKITETDNTGYLVTADDKTDDDEITDTEDYAAIDTHRFVNEELTSVTITKYGGKINSEHNLLPGATFTVYVLNESGEYEQYGEPLTTDENGKLTFTGLPAGTYKIEETSVPDGYMVMDDPIEVTLPFSSENEVDGAKYSARDGVYYIYELEYEVDNMAQLITMPNTGGRAWIIILLAVCGGVAATLCAWRYRKLKKVDSFNGKKRIGV